ncbi:MAG: DNA polymerase III subunit delta [bacterium]|nr:DNA polymerase III subunit delta [bacterium]
MLTILLGQDVLTKQQYVQEHLEGKNIELKKIHSGDTLPNVASLNAPALFGPVEAYLFEQCWKDLDPEQLLEHCSESSTQVFIFEDSIDQRKTVNKNFLRDKRVTVKEFESPSGAGAGKWIAAHAKHLQIKIEPKAVEALVAALVPDESGKLSVLGAHNELEKLKSCADGVAITESMVRDLVEPLSAINIFSLLDAIGTKNKVQATKLLEQFFALPGGDEKSKAIQISALLADQLRNIILVQDAHSRNLPEAHILEQTGWKSGRLFIIKKLSRYFTIPQLKQALAKIENLDIELKSSTLPPHVILDMVISQM